MIYSKKEWFLVWFYWVERTQQCSQRPPWQLEICPQSPGMIAVLSDNPTIWPRLIFELLILLP